MDHEPIVYELLERYGDRRREAIGVDDRLVADLRIDGDDFGMSIVPELKRRLNMHVPRTAWERVVTVRDLLAVVEEHARPSAK